MTLKFTVTDIEVDETEEQLRRIMVGLVHDIDVEPEEDNE